MHDRHAAATEQRADADGRELGGVLSPRIGRDSDRGGGAPRALGIERHVGELLAQGGTIGEFRLELGAVVFVEIPLEKPAAKAPAPAKKTVVTARPPANAGKKGKAKKKPKFLDPPKAKALPKKNKKRVVVKRK